MTYGKQVISIVGASGFLGRSLYNYLTERISAKYDVIGTFYSRNSNNLLYQLDIRNYKDVEKYILMHKPDYLILSAGTKDVQLCEKDYQYAYSINTKPVEIISQVIDKNQLATKFIFFSTDYVFDGERGYYRDTDTPEPKTNYGRTKLLAENLIRNSGVDFKIVRSSAVMGRGGLFFDWISEELKNKQEVRVFKNTYFSPTPIGLLNDMMLKLLEDYKNCSAKIIHIVGEMRLSRYDFVVFLSGYLTGSRACIIPEDIDFSISIFQKDLSLVQSDFVKGNQQKSFEEYIKAELKND